MDISHLEPSYQFHTLGKPPTSGSFHHHHILEENLPTETINEAAHSTPLQPPPGQIPMGNTDTDTMTTKDPLITIPTTFQHAEAEDSGYESA